MNHNQKLIQFATYASVTIALSLTLLKLMACVRTESLSLLASLIDSFFDSISSTILLFAAQQSQKRATRSFRFGYGKVEALAVLIQNMIMYFSLIILVKEAINNILHPSPIEVIDFGITVSIIAICVTAGLLIFQRYVIYKTNSLLIRSDCLHYLTDLVLNIAVLASLWLTRFTGIVWIDSAIACCIAIYVMYSLINVTKESIEILMDKELSKDFRQNIKNITLRHPQVKGLHDLRTRASGNKKLVQMHLELDGEITLNQSHKIAEEVEVSIQQQVEGCELIIHQDPCGIKEKRDIF